MRSTLVIRKHGQGYIATANNLPGGVSGARIGLTVEEAAIRAAELMAQVAASNYQGGDLVAPAEILERVPKHLHAVAAAGVPVRVETDNPQATQIASLHLEDFLDLPRPGDRFSAKDRRVYVVKAVEFAIGHDQGDSADHIQLVTILVAPYRIALGRSGGGRIAPRELSGDTTTVLEGLSVDAPDYVCWSCGATLVSGMHGFLIANADAIQCARCEAYNEAKSPIGPRV